MIRLLPLTESAAPLVLSWAEREDLSEYFRHFPPTIEWRTPEKMIAIFAHHYLVALDETLIGLAGFSELNPQSKSVAMGVLLDHKELEKPQEISKEVTYKIMDYIFTELRYNRLTCRILTTRSKLVQRLVEWGWTLEGTLKEGAYYRGEYRDEYLLSLTSKQYKEKR